MDDPKTSQEWWQGLGKLLLFGGLIAIGAIVSVAMELQQEVMSRRKVIFRVLFSICAGVIASIALILADTNEWYSAVIVPCATIMGQEFFKWVNSGGLTWLRNYFTRNGKKKDE